MQYQQLSSNNDVIFTNKRFDFTPESQWFSDNYWRQQGAITGHSRGRNITWFFRYDAFEFVLRHYFRGGLIGKFNKNLYWGRDVKKSRAFLEFDLLLKMVELDLPVPVPLAARVTPKWASFYHADLIIERIAEAKDLYHYLGKYPLPDNMWRKVGETIAQFHRHGVYHDDLNIHNILVDNQEKVWLIDFDKGCFKAPAKQWQQANLNRLLRSLRKEKDLNPDLNWRMSNWQALIDGYEETLTD